MVPELLVSLQLCMTKRGLQCTECIPKVLLYDSHIFCIWCLHAPDEDIMNGKHLASYALSFSCSVSQQA